MTIAIWIVSLHGQADQLQRAGRLATADRAGIRQALAAATRCPGRSLNQQLAE